MMHNSQVPPTRNSVPSPALQGSASATPGQAIRGKWVMDGAVTLAEAALHLQLYASWLQALGRLGWSLEAPIAQDIGVLVNPEGRISCLECGALTLPGSYLCGPCAKHADGPVR